MADSQLHGACSCGRNIYVVDVPRASTQRAQVLFDNSSQTRRQFASPFTAWLRVPFSWYRSTTFAFFPDETHRSIRRTFVSPFESNTRRQFCGYCGTQLAQWEDVANPADEYINLTLGSLLDEDLDLLEGMGLLPSSDNEEEVEQTTQTVRSPPSQVVAPRGAPWFESMVRDSRLGKFKRSRGGHTSRDGSVKVAWEVVEWTGEDDNESSNGGKRKFNEAEEGASDVHMRG
ncbi:hypothetical protein EJ06DRAFT_555533 [Trichodelitschia bisporula]|uniref:CENP-V/GFA domain-containing protein n=1 Tax=Trichodelitschia bisporula TaxID=703511 RepID=A0A6G1I0S4_9PEZI|nr:hypothetical protein EJ06DRAFT_555533 [Trichodelitschia bisporula]